MGRVAVGTYEGIRKSHPFSGLNHRGHFFQVHLVENAIARRNHVDIFKGGFGPVNEMKTIFVTAFFNGTVFCKGVFFKASMLHG